jgi:glucose/arabinose dehydrogenase
MSHRFLRTGPLAVSSLVLIFAGGVVAAACGSEDKDPTTSDDPLMPGGGNATGSGGSGGGSSSDPGNPPNNTNGGSTGTSEGQGGAAPIDNNPDNNNPPGNNGGSGGSSGDPTVDPPVGLAPNCNPPEGGPPDLTLQLVADGLQQPIHAKQAPGDDTRLFIVEKPGRVRVVLNGELQQTPFLTVGVANGNETGLLGLAFHPDYATNGLFYLHFSSNGGAGLPPNEDTVIAEYRVSADRNIADPESRRVVLTVDQPQPNHNGGEIAFGPDGMLYIGMGDGGGQNDTAAGHDPNVGNGQSLNTLLAKLLRIDPLGRDVGGAYSIPAGNTAGAARQEIFAYGLRNPWRFSFDACTGDLYIGDVGQNLVEEISYVAADSNRNVASGRNFGWRIMEAGDCFNPQANMQPLANCQQAGLTLPVDSYGDAVGNSITGGYVYRGSSIPGLRGTYIYADYSTARFFRFRIQNGAIADKVEITDQMRPAGGGNLDSIASFGTDNAGEMYVAAFVPGAVYRVAAAQ